VTRRLQVGGTDRGEDASRTSKSERTLMRVSLRAIKVSLHDLGERHDGRSAERADALEDSLHARHASKFVDRGEDVAEDVQVSQRPDRVRDKARDGETERSRRPRGSRRPGGAALLARGAFTRASFRGRHVLHSFTWFSRSLFALNAGAINTEECLSSRKVVGTRRGRGRVKTTRARRGR